MKKATIYNTEYSEFPWVRVFIEISVRALVDIHHRYLRNAYNQQNNQEPDFSLLNDGVGVAYADEITVCAAIYQEFISSRFTSNVYFQSVPSINVKEGKRNWNIQLFPPYTSQGHLKADFYVERVENTGEITPGTIPTMIEAKRAYLYSQGIPQDQVSEVTKDILKLRRNCGDSKRGYILIWGIQNKDCLGVNDYFKKININRPDILIRGVRQIPLSVFNNSKSINDVNIDKCLWISLAEVTKLHPELPNPDPIPEGYSSC